MVSVGPLGASGIAGSAVPGTVDPGGVGAGDVKAADVDGANDGDDNDGDATGIEPEVSGSGALPAVPQPATAARLTAAISNGIERGRLMGSSCPAVGPAPRQVGDARPVRAGVQRAPSECAWRTPARPSASAGRTARPGIRLAVCAPR